MNVCLGLWYQKGNIFGVSFWEGKKKRGQMEYYFFFSYIDRLTTCNFDTNCRKFRKCNFFSFLISNSTKRDVKTMICRGIHSMIRRFSTVKEGWVRSNDLYRTQSSSEQLWMTSVAMVTFYRYLKQSKWGTWTCCIILLNVMRPALISRCSDKDSVSPHQYCISQ